MTKPTLEEIFLSEQKIKSDGLKNKIRQLELQKQQALKTIEEYLRVQHELEAKILAHDDFVRDFIRIFGLNETNYIGGRSVNGVRNEDN